MYALDDYTLDILTRTALGEALGEPEEGQRAVVYSILNRARDPRWPGAPADVALQPKQYSAWNKGQGGNKLVNIGPSDPRYQNMRRIVEEVASGSGEDPTGGATHYFAPKGMPGGKAPNWWDEEVKRRGGSVNIGGHQFAGLASGSPQQYTMMSGSQGNDKPMDQPFQSPAKYNPGFFQGGGGDILQALGLSMMSSPRNNMLANFGDNYTRLRQETKGEEGIFQALVYAGMNEQQAKELARNPQAAEFALKQLEERRQIEADRQQMAQARELFSGGGSDGYNNPQQAQVDRRPLDQLTPDKIKDTYAAQDGSYANSRVRNAFSVVGSENPAAKPRSQNKTYQAALGKVKDISAELDKTYRIMSQGIGNDNVKAIGENQIKRLEAQLRQAEKYADEFAPSADRKRLLEIKEQLGSGEITKEEYLNERRTIHGIPSNSYKAVYGPDGNVVYEEGSGKRDEGGLGKPAVAELEKGIVATLGQLDTLKQIGKSYEDEFLTVQGRTASGIAVAADYLGLSGPEQKRRIEKVEDLRTNVKNLFNEYRREITGAAASVQELEQLKDAIINTELSPTQFRAKFQQFVQKAERGLELKRALLNSDIDVRANPQEFWAAFNSQMGDGNSGISLPPAGGSGTTSNGLQWSIE